MTTLVIATRNAHKTVEIRAILGEGFRYLTLCDFPGAPEVIEDAATFAGNASKKALVLAKWLAQAQTSATRSQNGTGLLPEDVFVLADDSGLEVDALNGAPGVHSARFAALDTGQTGNSATSDNNAKLLRLLKDVRADRRTARFRCAIALTPVLYPETGDGSPSCSADYHGRKTEMCHGVCEGHIGFEECGSGGFGYDPLFTPLGFTRTFGELPEETKNRLSHRAEALGKLKQRLATR